MIKPYLPLKSRSYRWNAIALLAILFIGAALPIAFIIGEIDPLYVLLGIFGLFLASVLGLMFPPMAVLGFLIISRSMAEGAQIVREILPSVLVSQATSALGALAVGWSIVYLVSRRIQILRIPLAKPILILLATMLIPAIWSVKAAGILEWIRLLSIGLIYFVAYSVSAQENRNQLILPVVLLLSTLIPLAVGFYMYVNGIVFRSFEFDRMISTFSSPNRYAIYLSQGLTICMALLLVSKRRGHRLILLVYAVLLGAGILFTFARVSWIIITVSLVILGLLRDKRLWLILFLGAIAAYQLPQVRGRLSSELLDIGSQTSTIGGRIAAWKAGFDLFMRSPILGHGLGYFRSGEVVLIGQWRIPHNVYVQVLVESGLLGLISFAILWSSAVLISLWHYLRSTPRSIWIVVLIALLSQILIAMFTENLFTDTANMWMFWSFAGYALANSNFSQNMQEPSPPPGKLPIRIDPASDSR